MPRRSRGPAPRAPPSRPTLAPAPKQQPTSFGRTNTSLAARPAPTPSSQSRAPEGQQSQSPAGGVLGGIINTAVGVAAGQVLGNAVGGYFGGTSGSPNESSPSPALPQSEFSDSVGRCGPLMKEFTQCMETNSNMAPCQWIFDQLKLCQQPGKDL